MASLTYPTDVGPYPSSPGGGGGGISEGEADARYTRRSLNASDFSDVATVRENIGVPVVDVAASGSGSTPTPYDAAIEAFGLSLTTFAGDTTLPNLNLDSSAVDPGAAAVIGYPSPSGPDGYGLIGLSIESIVGDIVNGAQSWTLVDAAGTPVGQLSISGDTTAFAPNSDPSFQRLGSGSGGTQTLKWIIPAGYGPGDLTLVPASGAIAGSPTLPNMEATVTWEFAQSSAQPVVSSFQDEHLVYLDYAYYPTVTDLASLGAMFDGFTHKPHNGSQWALNDSPTTQHIYTYVEGVFYLNPKQPSLPRAAFITNGVDSTNFDSTPISDLTHATGLKELGVWTVLGRTGFQQAQPNPILTISEAIVGAPVGEYHTLDDYYTKWHFWPNADGPATGRLKPLHGSSGRIPSRVFTYIDHSDDPSHVSIIRGSTVAFDGGLITIRDGLVDTDGSVTGAVGCTYLQIPYHGSLTLLADDQVTGQWVVDSKSGDTPVITIVGDGSTDHPLPNGLFLVYSDSNGGDTKLVLPDPTLQANGDEIRIVGVGTGLGILNGTGIPALDVQPNTVIDCYAYAGAWYASGATQGLVVD